MNPQTRERKRLTLRWFRQAHDAHTRGDLEAALPLYKRILHVEPNNVAALYGAAMLMWQLRENETALRWMLQVIARAPKMADAHYNLGVIYETLGRHTQAFGAYEQAILLKPDHGDSWEGLGKMLHAMGSAAEAVTCFEKAIAARAQNGQVTAESRYNMSYSLLALGRWQEGWAAYEARFESPIFMHNYALRHPEPPWDGAPLDGRRLLVHAEQGFGDSIMMARYLATGPWLDGRIHIEVQQPLVELFRRSFPRHTVSAQGEPHPACDLQLAMMSFPHRMHMHEGNVPTAPWLVPPTTPALPAGDGLKVGFVWAGSKDHRSDARRSIALEHWRPLFRVPGCTWYSLQVDQEPVSVPCHNLKPLIQDFADTAALIAQLDLVICCDTSVGHLAGALGKPVWLLLPTVPDYRWGITGPETCWYPTMRLVRQQVAGDWPGVMQEVRDGLEALVMAAVP